ncbi:MAG: hypothetical protein GYA73_04450, partial [Planctomycetes bacterium]|nr:hypothetical protein [Planctomycetota bacterium]
EAPAAKSKGGARAAKAPAAAAKDGAGAVDPQEDLSARLNRLEAEIAKLQKLKEEIEALGKDLKKEKSRTGFRSALKHRFDFGGEVNLELIKGQDESDPRDAVPEGSDGEPYAYLRWIRLKPRVDFTSKEDPIQVDLAGQLDFLARSEPRARVKELYVSAAGMHAPWADSRLRIGLDDRFMAPDNLGRIWPLSASSYWRNEELGFFWRTRLGDIREPWGRLGLHASLTNGMRLADENPNEAKGFDLTGHDARFGGNGSILREYGLGVGWERRWCEPDEVPLLGAIATEFMGFYYNDSLGDDDLVYLRSSRFEGSDVASSNLRGKELWGGNAILTVGGFKGIAHAMEGRDGKLRRKTGMLEASYRWDFEQPLFVNQIVRGVMPFVRYEWLDVSCPHNVAKSVTYDRKRWVLALVVPVLETIDLMAEYAINKDETGGRDPKNNELVFTLEIRF